ncbi:vWA domain-containing protein [Cyclobacterium salsum]|uniref:vWA domain-containing protein n=1 Tax=Cyclobacterium salsum TaxID=2666329 RepID=UPI001391E740|nr:vWA domain-containing protein [Cyclobacterium salsum]
MKNQTNPQSKGNAIIKKTYYHLVLDKSGSMDSCWSEARQVINKQLQDFKRIQSENPDSKIWFSYCAFNQALRFSSDLMPVEDATIDWATIYPEGMTALYDAIGESISYVKEKAAGDLKSEYSDVVMIILTDGHENASKKYSGQEIKEMIQIYELSEKWIFLFLGAGIEVTDVTKDLDRGSKNAISFAKSDFHFAFNLVSDELEDFVKLKSQGQKKTNFFEKGTVSF